MLTEVGTTDASPRAGEIRPDPGPKRPELRIAITSTFTAEPVESTLRFLLGGVGFEVSLDFADYNQVFQQLLDPASLLGRNTGGVNLVLVRFEDWARYRTGDPGAEAIRDGVKDLTAALRGFARRSSTPTVVGIGPPSPASSADPSRRALLAELEEQLREDVGDLGSVQVLGTEAFGSDPVEAIYDARRDQIGHMPYTPLFYTAIGIVLARRIHAVKAPACKVIALDCDHTLWTGVVGEDGPAGISIPPGKRSLQEFVVRQQGAGMLVCLVSKNVERDVFEVFETRPEMVLKAGHLVSHRVNWQPKSRNLAELAEELNLGLDSFVFIDDNPVECAEVRATHPGVLTLELPDRDEEIAPFIESVWAFDRLQVTEEDQKRTELYRQNVERRRFEEGAGSIDAFLAGLELQIDIAPPAPDELSRVAQLTQRTNQFNFTTVRRTEAEIRQLAASGLECLRVRVADRFGDYGLVGVLIFGDAGETLAIDTMLLSCRVLGRGVEHAMLAHLGRRALDEGKAWVEARFAPTPKNQPAANFLDRAGGSYREPVASGARFRLPPAVAAGLAYRPGEDAGAGLELAREAPPAKPSAARLDKSRAYQRLATEFRRIDAVHRALESFASSDRPDLDTPLAGPRNDRERALVAIWKEVLHLNDVGIDDEFTRLGGTSLKAAHLFVEIEERLGAKLPLTTILDASTIAKLAARIERGDSGGFRQALKVLKPGGPGPALFLVHDGDGETLLYANLARRMPEEMAVYGIEPHGTDRCPILHTRIAEMAAHCARLIREVQPEGPYFVGGMCAGGMISFETALQLEARGHAVGFIALFDSAEPHAPYKVGLTAGRRWARFSQAMQGGERTSRLTRLRRRVGTLGRKVKNLLAYETRTRTRRYVDTLRFRMLRSVLDRSRPVPRHLERLSVRTVYVLAEKEYAPAGLPACPVVLYRATEGEGADEPFVNRYADPLLGWGCRVRSGPAVVEVPGGHSSMLQEPNVSKISEHMIGLIHSIRQAELVT
jgi:FkbH-like protein